MSAQRSQSSQIQDDYVRTGEAVSLDITPASPGERFGSAVMDGTMYIMAALLILKLFLRLNVEMSSSSQRVFTVVLIAVTTFILPMTIEVMTRGRSLGKWAFNLAVVRDDGGPITARHSAVRMGVGLLENWALVGGLALASEVLNSKGKRLGDVAAGTMVCSQGSAAFYPPLVMPPGLAEWAATATILPLDESLVSEARAFLATNRSLNPHIREEVGASLANRLSRRVQTPLPQGLHPELVIAAVLVARRDRVWGREVERRAAGQARFNEATRARFGL